MTTHTRSPIPTTVHPARPARPTTPPARPGRFLTLPGVYAPQYDTGMLARALYRERIGDGTSVLDLGTGSGALAVTAARQGARVTALDISRRAVLSTRVNAWLSKQSVTVRRGDMTLEVPSGPYDLVVSNPPYVPSPSPLLPRRGAARAWDGGPAGRAVVDRVCDAAPGALRPGGVLLMVHSALCDVDASLERLAGLGMQPAVVDRQFIPFGPVMRAREAWLRRRRLIADDETSEELVVIRAERS
ncbi:HemK2/MTQ2 family protein methyltransferase [Streptomyces sp. NPDC093510]|uniref:HemK2/MTQ2 family protein methyltransferase n=1 Tax=Streptomyces sp. NPDC093510 TaxID=3155199 RepID=UPI0034263A59